jgi:penicillin amidase
VCPNFNITYAGADGRIAYFLSGVIPKRKKDTPLRPLEGWTGEWDWDGVVPTNQNPRLIDPECGFCVTANNRPAPFDYPYELGNTFEPPDRYNRLTELLKGQGTEVTFADMAQNMLDLHATWGLETRALFLEMVGGIEGLGVEHQSIERSAADIWLAWDGQATRESAGAAIAYATAMLTGAEVMQRLAGPETGRAFMELASFMGQPVLRLKDAQALLAEHGVDACDAIRTAFQQAVALCIEEMGDDTSAWQWGKLHVLRGKHALSGSPLGWLFTIGPEAVDGGPDTANRGDVDASGRFSYKVGPAMRMVINPASAEYASVIPGGQSGNRFSKHYDDQLPEFLAGRLKKVRVSRTEIAAARAEKWSVPKS